MADMSQLMPSLARILLNIFPVFNFFRVNLKQIESRKLLLNETMMIKYPQNYRSRNFKITKEFATNN